MRTRIVALAVLFLFILGAVSVARATDAHAQPPISINGTWTCCGLGGAGAQLWVIDNNGGTLETPTGEDFGSLQVSYNVPAVQVITTYISPAGYVATFDGTLSDNDSVITGTWTSDEDQSGTFTATFTDSLPRSTVLPTHTGTVAPITASLGTPGEVFHSMTHNLGNAAITVGAILFIAFPASIFNSTFGANYEEILLIFARWRRRARKILSPTSSSSTGREPPDTPSHHVVDPDMPGKTTRPWFYAVLVVGAVLGGLLNPKFGFNQSSVAGFLATLVAFVVGATISWFVTKRFRQHHKYGTRTYLHALPVGLVIAALCVLISRLSSFEPGYLYGVVVSISFAETIESRHSAHLVALSTGSTLLVALTSWFLWIPLNHFALQHSGSVPLAVVDDLLGSIFVGGLVGSVVSLLPLLSMPGRTLATWRKDAWALTFFVAIFLLVSVELRPAAGPTHPGSAPLVTVIALLVLFGGATFLMRWYFSPSHDRPTRLQTAAVVPAPPAVATDKDPA